MALSAWLHFFDGVPAAARERIVVALTRAGVVLAAPGHAAGRCGLVVLVQADDPTLARLRDLCASADVLAIAVGAEGLASAELWAVLNTGATDVLCWPCATPDPAQVTARLERSAQVRALVESDPVRSTLVGASRAWRRLVQGVVEIAAFADAPVLITGETGTGKDLIAQVIHKLDRKHGQFTVLDCTTLSPELAGSELFGHEKGAFTGAANAREGAFAHAHGGVLFLDEVGELPLPLQAQLLRVIQEHTYKRIGSNNWQYAQFRLLCATNRDLEHEVERGRFRADLFHRIAALRCRTLPLRERIEDVLPLAQHFLTQLAGPGHAPGMDPAVREYFLTRQYPGNVRDLRQAVTRAWHRHAGPGPLTVGDLPPDERPAAGSAAAWPDHGFEDALRHAVQLGIPLSRITQGAGDLAIQLVLAQEGDNNQRAAARLGVTDRALQIRRKGWPRP